MNPECRAIESQDDPDCPCCVCGKESYENRVLEDGIVIAKTRSAYLVIQGKQA